MIRWDTSQSLGVRNTIRGRDRDREPAAGQPYLESPGSMTADSTSHFWSMQGGPTPSLRAALVSQSLTAVREDFSATGPKPNEDPAGEFPSASAEPEVGRDRALSEGINSGL